MTLAAHADPRALPGLFARRGVWLPIAARVDVVDRVALVACCATAALNTSGRAVRTLYADRVDTTLAGPLGFTCKPQKAAWPRCLE